MKLIPLLLLGGITLSPLSAWSQSLENGRVNPLQLVDLPKGAPTWMAELQNIDTINYHQAVARFRKFQADNSEMRKKTPHNKPILNYFRRWQKAYAPYVMPDGRIRPPKQTEFFNIVEEMNATQRAQRATRGNTPSEGWRVISPMVTYHSETKQVRPWQANIQRFDVSTTDPNILYCGSETGLVFKTTDKGENWNVCAQNHYFGGEINALEISRKDPNRVVVTAGALVWLTTDGGETWSNITPEAFRTTFKRVRDVVIHPTDDHTFLLANDQGVYKTKDSGKTWYMVDSGQSFDLKFKVNEPNVVYALVRKGTGVQFRKSTDGGEHFQERNLGYGSPLASGRIGLSDAPNGGEYIYLLACTADSHNSFQQPYWSGKAVLFKSTDAGESWMMNADVSNKMESFDRNGGQGFYDMVVHPSPKNPDHLLFGLLNLYYTENFGATLENIGGYYGRFDMHCDMQDLKTVGGDTWLSTDGGMILSTDFFKTTATPRINGIYASEFWGFDQGWNEDVIVGGRNHNGNMVQIDRYDGVSISVGGSEVSTGYVFLSNPRKVAFSDAGSSYLPDDWKTQEFLPFSGFWTFPKESTQYGIGFEYDPRYAKSFYINNDNDPHALWKTVNDGESFVKIYTFDEPVSAYAVSRANPDLIVVGTVAKLYRSEDGGDTFTEILNLPHDLANTTLFKIALHPRNEQEFWVSSHNQGGIFRTQDGGRTWQQMNDGLQVDNTSEQRFITRFFLTGNEKNAVYALAGVQRYLDDQWQVFYNRVLYRDDTTHGWQDFSEGLPAVSRINRMLPFYKKGLIRIATSNGIWERSLVDADFRPIAQPLALSAGTSENTGEGEWQLESFSIVNQENAEWEWSFSPEPLSVSDRTARNPKIRVAADQSYDVTLKVTTPAGTDTKTVKNMIKGRKDVITTIDGEEVLPRDVDFERTVVSVGESINVAVRGLSQTVRLSLYDGNGRLVRSLNLLPHQRQQLELGGLAAGTYYYQCVGTGFQKAGRLQIQ